MPLPRTPRSLLLLLLLLAWSVLRLALALLGGLGRA
jgi:hypothetical protein